MHQGGRRPRRDIAILAVWALLSLAVLFVSLAAAETGAGGKIGPPDPSAQPAQSAQSVGPEESSKTKPGKGMPTKQAGQPGQLRPMEQASIQPKTMAEQAWPAPDFPTAWRQLQELVGPIQPFGRLLGFWQHTGAAQVGEDSFPADDSTGFVAQLGGVWQPWHLKDTSVDVLVQYGQGGVTGTLQSAGLVAAHTNAISDDSLQNGWLRVLEARVTQEFLNKRAWLVAGWADPETFIDTNAFANDPYGQFVSTPFMNDPVFDTEDVYGPFLLAGGKPADDLEMVVMIQSTTRPNDASDQQKDPWEQPFSDPWVGGQLTWSPSIAGRQGHYRVYPWAATYDRPRLDGQGDSIGWGVGFSADQWITDNLGLFARAGYHNPEVYDFSWLATAGLHLQGLVSGRPDDVQGLGVGAMLPSPDHTYDGAEWHFEAYWRVFLTDFFSITPDVQLIVQPQGDRDADPVAAFTLRSQLFF